LSTGELHVIPNQRCRVKGLLVGPRVVQECTATPGGTSIRFVDANGTVAQEWKFTELASILDVQASKGQLALHFSKPASSNEIARTHDFSIVDAVDRRELQRWSQAPGAGTYFGTFMKSGKTFCALQATIATADSEFICWDVQSGSTIVHKKMTTGFSAPMIAAGDRVGMEHSDVKTVPRVLTRLAETNFTLSNPTHVLWDIQSDRQVAQWPAKTQWVLPGVDARSVWAVSNDGDTIAEGESGTITLYRLAN
jgi:hypothetical protein